MNILEKFNPGARQLISAGKAYLKALHGTAAASRVFNEALAKIAVNAQQGGTTDIGSALMNIVGVYKEIQDQHMNILKAFYVDLLVPLETNLEKDTKVVQFEQKKFLQQHKIRADSYSKAAATMKKQRKKKATSQNADKEIKSIQAMDEEKNKLDTFCEQSLKNAMTQERRRYGFVLERQCSLAKHWMAYHSAGKNCIASQLDNWEEISVSREFLPPNMESIFARQMMMENDENDSERGSIISAMRKTRSIDASCLDMRSIVDVVNSSSMNMPRAKSEFNLTSSVAEGPKWDQRTISRGLYAYLSSGENQLSFLEGDRIALVGDRAKGWQFGENLRTHTFGWFPVAYTELEHEDNHSNWGATTNQRNEHSQQQPSQNPSDQTPDSSLESTIVDESIPSKVNAYHDDSSPTRMFGDTIMYRQSKQFRRISGGAPKPGPPPTLPAPVPTPVVPASYPKNQSSHSFSSAATPNAENRKSNYTKQSASSNKPKPRNGVTNASLHSSNDSGFANDPPPQPDVDYSDEETLMRVPLRSHPKETVSTLTKQKSRIPRRSNDSDTLQSTRKGHSSMSNIHAQTNNRSHSHGNLTDENSTDFYYRTLDRQNGNIVKRTKSFWKFGKHDDILEGMAMWKHRDLVLTENEKNEERTIRETTLRRRKKSNDNNNTISTNSSETLKNGQTGQGGKHELLNGKPRDVLMMNDNSKYHLTKSDIDQRVSKQQEENIYGVHKPRAAENLNSNRGKMMRQTYTEDDMEKETRRQPRSEKYRGNRADTKIPSHTSSNRNGNSNKVINGGIQNNSKHKGNRSNLDYSYDSSRENMDSLSVSQSFDDSSLIMNDPSVRVHDSHFYDDDSVDDMQLMKTVKRQEILKQYYSSGTDTERNSSSSDPYDCIVVDDHLVRRKNEENKNPKMDFKTFRGDDKDSGMESSRTATLLPRTKLTKTSSNERSSGQNQMKHSADKQRHSNGKLENKRASRDIENSSAKSYGPWYDLWAGDGTLKK
ncbi:hypothetical protein HA402_007615 [Bradysia odoriphaga]|nr:hypothetical protein HA402_007615 [Bradysia odoriphaga]